MGMIVGENPRADDLPINPTREKHLSNVRSKGEGKGIQLTPPHQADPRARHRIHRARTNTSKPRRKTCACARKFLRPEDRKRESKQLASVA